MLPRPADGPPLNSAPLHTQIRGMLQPIHRVFHTEPTVAHRIAPTCQASDARNHPRPPNIARPLRWPRVEGGVGSGRSWVESSAELRFPLVDTLSGCCFFDCGSDLNSGATVIGNPAGTRNKPGQ
eukprot:363865-Chlamydomonas_euryale.AAC.4